MRHSFSDHRHLRYVIESNATKSSPTRNPRNTDWKKFANLVQSKVRVHKRINIKSFTVLDDEVNSFNNIISLSVVIHQGALSTVVEQRTCGAAETSQKGFQPELCKHGVATI